MKTLRIQSLHELAKIPTRAYPDDAGLDLASIEFVRLEPGCGQVVRTGIAIELDSGYVGLIWDRSSMGRRGIKTLGGVIDSGYRGEIGVVLWNLTLEPVEIQPGERVAQLLIQSVVTPNTVQAESLSPSARSGQGFGSSGR
jgi:dUTP pyrophosphatase